MTLYTGRKHTRQVYKKKIKNHYELLLFSTRTTLDGDHKPFVGTKQTVVFEQCPTNGGEVYS